MGGTPEILAFNALSGYQIKIWSGKKKLLFKTGSADYEINLQYEAEHYTLMKGHYMEVKKFGFNKIETLRGGAEKKGCILKTREQVEEERRVSTSTPPARQAPLPPLERPKRKQTELETGKKEAEKSRRTNRPVSPVLKPKKAEKQIENKPPLKEPKETKVTTNCEVIIEGEHFCFLCGKWSNAQHRASIKHMKKLQYFHEMDAAEQADFKMESVKWATKTAKERLRGGAKQNESTKTENEDEQKQSAAASSSGTAPQEPISIACEHEQPSTELAQLMTAYYSHSPSCDDCEKDDENVPMEDHLVEGTAVREDVDSDFGRESITASFQSDLSENTPLHTDEAGMTIWIGKKLAKFLTCPDTSTVDLIAHLAIMARLPAESVAVVRGSEMITLNSCLSLYLPLHGTPWKLRKLPLSAEHREGQQEPKEEVDDTIDERCQLCGGTAQQLAPDSDGQEELSVQEETERMRTQDVKIVTIKFKRARDTLVWTAHKGVTASDVLKHYAAVKRVRLSGLEAYEQISPHKAFLKDEEILLKTGQPVLRRGGEMLRLGSCIFKIVDHIHSLTYDAFLPEYVGQLREHYGTAITVLAQGMKLPDEMYLTELRWRTLAIVAHSLDAWPRLSSSESTALSPIVPGQLVSVVGTAAQSTGSPGRDYPHLEERHHRQMGQDYLKSTARRSWKTYMGVYYYLKGSPGHHRIQHGWQEADAYYQRHALRWLLRHGMLSDGKLGQNCQTQIHRACSGHLPWKMQRRSTEARSWREKLGRRRIVLGRRQHGLYLQEVCHLLQDQRARAEDWGQLAQSLQPSMNC